MVDLAKVHRLPVRSDAEVVDAEIVEDGPSLPRRVVAHPHARTAALHAAFVAGGVVVLVRRWAVTRGLTARMLRQAERDRNREEVRYWHEQHEQAKDRRHKRRMDLMELPFRAAKVAGLALGLTFGGLFALGIVLWLAGQAKPFDPILAFAGFIGFLWWAVTTFWIAAVALGVTGVCAVLWRIGKAADVAPAWLAPQEVVTSPVGEITPERVVLAFRELGIAPLRKAIVEMEDGGGWMLSNRSIAGCGVEVHVTLPPVGVTTTDIIARRQKLAENLDRHEHEVHLRASAKQPRTVVVWAADPGALDEPIGPSPLARDTKLKADYTKGAPFGVSLRGDPVTVNLHQKHVLCAGMSNQGKTKTLRALALWLALDPKVELWIADLKGYNDETGVSDWEMFRPIARRFVAGPTDDHVVAAVEMLEDAVTEMKRRLVTGGRHHPIVVIIDEVQVMYMSPAKDAGGRHYGGSKSTSRGLTAVRELHNQGRVTNTLLWEGTQDPSNQNYPVLARNGIHLRICTAISEESQARMVLQDKAVNAGAAPHLLRLGADKGTVVVAGDGAPLGDGEMFKNVRVHYLDDRDAGRVAKRAEDVRGPVTPWDEDEVRDIVQDVHEALEADATLKATRMVARLQDLAPGYRPYQSLTGQGLADWLGREGIAVRDMDGVLTVRAERVLQALDRRQGVR